ncbi:MAG: hypothetical protein IT434_01710 [Phycisphaerales bacterium]|jgi:hypothetical protein|nr:hypothetical protein [Phycisphaerales bacterium]
MPAKSRILPVLAASLVLFAGASRAMAQELTKEEQRERAIAPLTLDPRDETNAALHYYRIMCAPFGEAATMVGERRSSDDWIPDAETATALENEQGTITQFIRASKLKECAWGTAYYTDGFEALLPALGKMRTAARLLSADARRLASQGESRQAAERLAAMYRISDHVARENILIGSLVGIAISSLACGDVKLLVDKGWLDTESRALIVAAASQARASDFHMKSAIATERMVVDDWFRRVIRRADLGKKLGDYVSMQDGDASKLDALLAMSPAELDKQIDEAVKFYDDAIAAFYQPDGEALLKTLGKDVEDGRYGLFGSVFCPAFEKCRVSWGKGMSGIDEVIKLLGGAPSAPAESVPRK